MTDQGHSHFFKVFKFSVMGRVTACRHGDKQHNAVKGYDCPSLGSEKVSIVKHSFSKHVFLEHLIL